ncbi:hypothetical protein HC251_09415 [Iamia sp. SCSIO 61187]|uniref:hypothetical protein n=1 Tax=Iamia sp. SCSIO 61187 TaxID=2722752 RepID=UPI001C62F80A|nr:hypothetical protein [Iamia sp. SCSIO 61187]QYG92632.1 hypothetical protein HC251_09415 [Iamia sp. SCSIO 61187]
MSHRSLALMSVLSLAAAGVAGCGGDDADRLTAGDGFSVEAALAELPAPPGDGPGSTITIVDLAAAAEANGAGERPEPDDGDAVGEWVVAATGTATDDEDVRPIFVPTAEVLGFERLAAPEELEAQLGWSVLDVDAVAEVVEPPFRFAVVTGDVGDESFSDAGLEPDDDGVVSFGEGDDGEIDPESAGPATPLGAPLRMAADGDRLVTSSSTDAVTGWLDDDATTLADDDDVRAVAAALDDADAVSAFITTFSQSARYDALGIGWAVDDGEPRMAIAYVFADDDAAEQGAEDVEAVFDDEGTADRAPVSDHLTLDEVEVDGSLVVAHVRPGPEGRPQTPLVMLQRGDVLFTLPGS